MEEATPQAVFVVWWIALGVTVVLVVPLAWYLLHRTWRAAREIQRYAADALEAGVGIKGNTALIPVLDDTITVAGRIAEKAGTTRKATGRIAEILTERTRS